ncbi:MAG: hypothetical protein WA789_02370 [Candidatus Acidiferrum sp.]
MRILGIAAIFLMVGGAIRPVAARRASATVQAGSPQPASGEVQAQVTQAQEATPAPEAPGSNYDKSIFQKPIPSDQMKFLSQFSGAESGDLVRNKQYRKLMHNLIPDCIFHYGWDMSLPGALEKVLTGSPLPVQIRQGRYLMLSGRSGPYLAGRGFMWIDMRDGIGLGGFYFHPTNGEPTPTVTIFSKQLKEKLLEMSQLPPAFAEDLREWSRAAGIPPVTTRYFISGQQEKILLEHDEDYCALAGGTGELAGGNCEQLNAGAADIDLNAAYYLEQTHHATNGTAWMIVGQDQIAWIAVRDKTCRLGPYPVLCHIRMTRERTHVIIRSHPVPHPPRA